MKHGLNLAIALLIGTLAAVSSGAALGEGPEYGSDSYRLVDTGQGYAVDFQPKFTVAVGPIAISSEADIVVAGDPPPAPVEAAAVVPAEPAGDDIAPGYMYGWLQQAGWPESLWHEAAIIASCESGFKPDNVGDNGHAMGLFQIRKSQPGWNGWFLYFGEDEGQWADPVFNARVAFKIYQYDVERGYDPWAQWSCRTRLN